MRASTLLNRVLNLTGVQVIEVNPGPDCGGAAGPGATKERAGW